VEWSGPAAPSRRPPPERAGPRPPEGAFAFAHRLDNAARPSGAQATRFVEDPGACEAVGEEGCEMAGVGYVVAFGGGVASFVSPCVLPVVPAYLSVVTGIDVTDRSGGPSRQARRVARDTALFVCGFGAVFVALGVSATAFGAAVLRNRLLLTEISGGVVIAMACYLAGSLVLPLPALYGEARLSARPSSLGPLAAPLAGAAFGLGWTPCIGPVLTSVLAVAASERGIGNGAGLLGAYALGLGVPFLLVGLGWTRLARSLGFLRRHSAVIVASSAALLFSFGVLLVMNRISLVTSELETALRAIGLGRLVSVG
jgi:cytochrome c-type biogenesis protein